MRKLLRDDRWHLLRLFVAVAVFSLTATSCTHPRIQARGQVAGQDVNTTVDAEIARYYLEECLTGPGVRACDDRFTREALERADALPLSNAVLHDLTRKFSTDFATLYFVERVHRERFNRRLQEAFRAELAFLRANASRQSLVLPKAYQEYLFVFVPGYAYRKDTTTGADFARQRRLLDRAGGRTVLIQTEELGTVEENAGIVAREIVRLTRLNRPIVLVSTSKAGPEVALALGRELGAARSKAVRAWISIGGLLRGSPYADRMLSWPMNWVAWLVLRAQGLKPDVIRDLSTPERRPVFERLVFPEHVLMIQYVGVPLSGHINKDVRSRYDALGKIGPNDGLTLLADEIIPAGGVITDIGLDHFYRDPEIDLKAIALAALVLKELHRGELQKQANSLVSPSPDPATTSRELPNSRLSIHQEKVNTHRAFRVFGSTRLR
ncbi:MAG: hypothetical protein HY526_08145 [Betaproteobacteria bacterium]|nr:hypothetical protein [Betaproteobacteria bacterium]